MQLQPNQQIKFAKKYIEKVLPLENLYQFKKFYPTDLKSPLTYEKPTILILGPECTGKTTLIRHLIGGQDFPGMVTERGEKSCTFTALIHGDQDRIIPSNLFLTDKQNEFAPLAQFGSNFLTDFQFTKVNSSVLKSITIVDTPGILAGKDKQLNRGYDFVSIIEWLAHHSACIILVLDPHNLHISAQFRTIIEQALWFNRSKIRILINKIDTLDHTKVLHVNRALMFNLGSIGPPISDIPVVYMGAYGSKVRVTDPQSKKLLKEDEKKMLSDIQSLVENPWGTMHRDYVKRTRMVKSHAYLCNALREAMPWYLMSRFGNRKSHLIQNLGKIVQKLQQDDLVPSVGDFPDMERLKEKLETCDFYEFPLLKYDIDMEQANQFLRQDVPQFSQFLDDTEGHQGGTAAGHGNDTSSRGNGGSRLVRNKIVGGPFDQLWAPTSNE